MKNLPTLQELKEMRQGQINEALSSGLIDKTIQVVEFYGDQIDEHTHTPFLIIEDGYEFKVYHQAGLFSVPQNRGLIEKILVVMKDGLIFVNLNLYDIHLNERPHSVVVLGDWTVTILNLWDQMQKDDDADQKDKEEAYRVKLAKMLHII